MSDHETTAAVSTAESAQSKHGDDDLDSTGQGNRRDIVTIIVNNKSYPIHRGRHSVSNIKRVGGVPLADELAEVIEKNTPPLTPLSDDGAVTIKGGEIFVSYPKDSGSSSCGPLTRISLERAA